MYAEYFRSYFGWFGIKLKMNHPYMISFGAVSFQKVVQEVQVVAFFLYSADVV